MHHTITITDLPDGFALATVTGDIDQFTSGQLETRLTDTIIGQSAHLAVDLSRVPFIDSTGVTALITAHHTAHAHDGRLCLIGPTPPVQRLLALTKLDRLLPIHATTTELLTCRACQPAISPPALNHTAAALPQLQAT